MKNLCAFYFVIFSFIACSGTKEESKSNDDSEDFTTDLVALLGREIIYPDNLVFFSPETTVNKIDSVTMYSSQLKIVTHIDADCGSCVSELKEWENFIDVEALDRLSYLFIVSSSDRLNKFQWMYEKEIILFYPVLLDVEQKFSTLNNLPSDKRFHCFLLNTRNEVLAVGNPLVSKAVLKLYKDQIKKHSI